MTTALLRIILLLALVVAALGGAPASAQTAAPASGSDFPRDVEKQTFGLINHYRDQAGLPLLTWNDDIARLARGHSREMATGIADFGHGGFSDRVQQMKSILGRFQGAGENVLYTTQLDQVAARAVQMWLHSPHHLRNIRGDYNLSGIGVWISPSGTIYFTQLFLKAGG